MNSEREREGERRTKTALNFTGKRKERKLKKKDSEDVERSAWFQQTNQWNGFKSAVMSFVGEGGDAKGKGEREWERSAVCGGGKGQIHP